MAHTVQGVLCAFLSEHEHAFVVDALWARDEGPRSIVRLEAEDPLLLVHPVLFVSSPDLSRAHGASIAREHSGGLWVLPRLARAFACDHVCMALGDYPPAVSAGERDAVSFDHAS